MAIAISFRDELEAAVLERHCANHPMTEKWARGELGRNPMMGWAVEHWHWISRMKAPPLSSPRRRPATSMPRSWRTFARSSWTARLISTSCCASRRRMGQIRAKMRWFYFDGIYLHYELGYPLR